MVHLLETLRRFLSRLFGWRGVRSPSPEDVWEREYLDEPIARLERQPRIGHRPSRFANVRASGLDDGPLPTSATEPLVLHIAIGPHIKGSVIHDFRPWPETGPPTDHVIVVQATSLEFDVHHVGSKDRPFGLLVLGTSGSSHTVDDAPELRIVLTWRDPHVDSAGRSGRVRITYSFRNAVVQSQLITVHWQGGRPLDVRGVTDYSVSATLNDLGAIPSRTRISVVTNDTDDDHGFVIRLPESEGSPSRAFNIPDDALQPLVSSLRAQALRSIGPGRSRSERDFIEDLRRLAPIGWKLYSSLFSDVATLLPVSRGPRPLIQVVRPAGVRFTIPWNYLYEIPFTSSDRVDRVPVCPVVRDAEARASLAGGLVQECPYAGTVSHDENLLCPFGFWGYRQPLEAPAASQSAESVVRLGAGSRVAFGRTNRSINRTMLDQHLATVQAAITARAPVAVSVDTTQPGIRSSIAVDLPLIYLFCHGGPVPAGNEIGLALDDDVTISPTDVTGWIVAAHRAGSPIWREPRPFVVINACQSGTATPLTLSTFADAFVGSGNGIGVVGTEVKVPQPLAGLWAEQFFSAFLKPGATLQDALLAARLWFLEQGNLFGLVYSTQSWAHVRVE